MWIGEKVVPRRMYLLRTSIPTSKMRKAAASPLAVSDCVRSHTAKCARISQNHLVIRQGFKVWPFRLPLIQIFRSYREYRFDHENAQISIHENKKILNF